jgi:hypothetical protein
MWLYNRVLSTEKLCSRWFVIAEFEIDQLCGFWTKLKILINFLWFSRPPQLIKKTLICNFHEKCGKFSDYSSTFLLDFSRHWNLIISRWSGDLSREKPPRKISSVNRGWSEVAQSLNFKYLYKSHCRSCKLLRLLYNRVSLKSPEQFAGFAVTLLKLFKV